MTMQGWKTAESRSGERSTQSFSDLQLVEKLLDEHDHNLRGEEQPAFARMREYLISGTSRVLSQKQRAWAKKVLDRLGASYENLVSEGVVPNRSSRVFEFEKMPRPLKPPGR